MSRYAIGMDFGTLSGRAVLVDVADGRMVAEGAMDYPHAVMDTALPSGRPLGKDWALQHPQDYLDVMDALLPALTGAVDPAEIVAVGVDVTSATAMPVDGDFTPLCLTEKWQDDPYAYAMMWKHHACHRQAQRMTDVAVDRGEKWLPLYGGKINVEWYFPKLLQILEERPEVYHAMDQYVEAVEWLVWQLTGSYVRSEGCVGYKALYAGGYPSEEYFAAVNPDFRHVVGTKHRGPIGKLGSCAGRVTQEASARWGLAPGTPVAVGNIDAHVCMPASGITAPGSMLAIIGTSTVTLLVGEALQAAPGICGAVQDGVLPGFAGYEAGQSCVGDSFRWYENNAVPAYITEAAAREGIGVQAYLTRLAEKLRPGESGLIALDWFNGNRSILADPDLTGMIVGLTLQTRPEEIYRALIESTAYGCRVIVDNYREHGVAVEAFYASGGISQKNAMAMQIYADVLNMPVRVVDAAQGPALGSAIFGAVAAGEYPTVEAAIRAMSSPVAKVYEPDTGNAAVYDRLYREYKALHDLFSQPGSVMKRLRGIRA